jgi:gluconokinase
MGNDERKSAASVQVIATGGALSRSATWMTMIADALGCPVVASTEPEATSRGTALLALEALGVLPDLADAPVLLGDTFEPSPEHHAIYQSALARQQHLYQRAIVDDERGRLRP